MDDFHLLDSVRLQSVKHHLAAGGKAFNGKPAFLAGGFHIAGDVDFGRVVKLLQFRQRLFFQIVHRIQNVFIAVITERTKERADQELPAPTLAVKVDLDAVALVELDFQPGTMVGNHLVGAQHLSAGMAVALEAHARRTMQLADDDAFRAIDDKRAALRHQRDIADVDAFLFHILAIGGVKTECNIQGSLICQTVLQAFDQPLLGLADFIFDKLKARLAVRLLLRREDILERFLQPLVQTLFRWRVLL